mmetsp:Transcript_11120/g.9848  ORF Transcript_11120/g.9848 Transcript_11120/m.9848 type:complete len:119 (-) Transcript_11120:3-359(-)
MLPSFLKTHLKLFSLNSTIKESDKPQSPSNLCNIKPKDNSSLLLEIQKRNDPASNLLKKLVNRVVPIQESIIDEEEDEKEEDEKEESFHALNLKDQLTIIADKKKVRNRGRKQAYIND